MPLKDHALPVSVVIPCFHCTATINRAVESIVSQTKRPAEVIMVDDASGDDTWAVLQKLSARLEQISALKVKLLQLPENRGAASARNAGWEAASQPYIAFLDADDTWHPDKLHVQYAYMQANPDIAVSGHQCVWLSGGRTPPSIIFAPGATIISAASLLFRNGFSTPTVMLKRDIPFRFGEHKRYAEDFYLWQQVAFSGLSISRLEVPLAYVHKPIYGDSGLSAQLWKMERSELDNFLDLYRSRHIGVGLLAAASSFSALKYCRRLFVSPARKLFKSFNQSFQATN